MMPREGSLNHRVLLNVTEKPGGKSEAFERGSHPFLTRYNCPYYGSQWSERGVLATFSGYPLGRMALV